MALKIMPHGRLQEWVAEEKGYFTAEGLEYSFVLAEDYGVHRPRRDEAGEIKTGAFETFGTGRDGADVSCACHWATSAAASERAGQLVTTAYSVANCAIVVPPESPIRRPEELAGVAIGVGYHSGSHFATVQALEGVLAPDELKLSFQGPPNERLDALLQRQVPAATTWGVPLYIAEAFGFRKIVDATFMIGFLVTGLDVSKAEVEKYLSALRRAQLEIDLHPELYKHYHLRAVPEKYRDQVDVRAFGTGERIVFLSYTREVFAATQHWTEAHHLFPERPESLRGYDEAALVLPGWAEVRAVLPDAAEEARTMVAAVRHDPALRLELASRFYDDRPGRASIRAYRRAELAFMRWQVSRGVLAPPESARPGSEWWRSVNESLLRDACEADRLAAGRPGQAGRPTVARWLDFLGAPSARTFGCSTWSGTVSLSMPGRTRTGTRGRRPERVRSGPSCPG